MDMDKIADADRREKRHFVHGRRYGGPARVTTGNRAGRVVNQLHDHTAMHGPE